MRGQEPLKPHDADERQIDPVSILKVTDNKNETLWDIATRRRRQPGHRPRLHVSDLGHPHRPAECKTFGCSGIHIAGYTAGSRRAPASPTKDDPVLAEIGETWAFGYSPDFVVGIWAGNSDNSCLVNVSSASLAFYAMSDAFTTAMAGIRRRLPASRRRSRGGEMRACPGSCRLRCWLRSKDLFVKSDVPAQDDTWWQKVKIDKRNAKLAARRLSKWKRVLVLPQEQLDRTKEARPTGPEGGARPHPGLGEVAEPAARSAGERAWARQPARQPAVDQSAGGAESSRRPTGRRCAVGRSSVRRPGTTSSGTAEQARARTPRSGHRLSRFR